MKFTKIAASIMCCLIAATAFAQNQSVTSGSKSDSSVESEYLNTLQDSIITSLATSDDYDQKWVALQYLEDAVASGRSSVEMTSALVGLAGEGTITQSRQGRRVVNNFPDIRARACDLLGETGDESVTGTLVDIAKEDREPMVQSAAVRALANVAGSRSQEAVEAIAWIQKRNAALNPTSSLAFEVLNAYEKLAGQIEDTESMLQSISAIASDYHYVTPVRTKALDLLKKLNAR
ncbi:MAG TPA: HEAT repeat domain-containing protein [Treponema sp.]|jgi:hypothetical protein|nr:HEAT repeat domain-containing protein [Treponema sp.]HBD68982.1 HEAT repeat domain-containing protein [Treponema sp.]